MSINHFWSLVEGLPPESAEQALEERLKRLSPEELIAFDRHFTELFFRAYDWQLWNAAYIIAGGCSNDSFMDFRYGLISRGRAVFEAALKDPDTLASIVKKGEDLRNEAFASVAFKVYKRKTGTEMPDPDIRHPGEPSGEDWDPDNEELCARHLPKLWAKFGAEFS